MNVELHAAAQPVSYTGAVRMTFLETRLDHEVKQALEPGKDARTVSVIDAVTSTAGEYAIEVDLVAQMGETRQPIRLHIPVVVQPSARTDQDD